MGIAGTLVLYPSSGIYICQLYTKAYGRLIIYLSSSGSGLVISIADVYINNAVRFFIYWGFCVCVLSMVRK